MWRGLLVVAGCSIACGQATADDVTATTDASTDAALDAEAGDCFHLWECAAVGTTCVNGCGRTCTCTATGGGLRIVCEPAPASGSGCIDQGTFCSYTSSSDVEPATTCSCESPAGEPFWSCNKGPTICPPDQPASGSSCAPAGFYCFYGETTSCECRASAKEWACQG